MRGLKFSKTFISFWKSKDWYLEELALDQEDLTPESTRFLAGEKRQSTFHITVWEALKERFRTCVSPREGGPYSAWEGFLEVVYFALGHCCSVTHCVQLSATPWTTPRQLFLSFTISQSLFKLMSIESMIHQLIQPSIHPTISYSVIPFSFCLQLFSASGSFLMSRLLASGGQSIGASASVLLMNIQDWFPLGLTGLISFQSKGLSSIFSNTTVQKHQFFSVQPSLWSNLHIHAWLLKKPQLWLLLLLLSHFSRVQFCVTP